MQVIITGDLEILRAIAERQLDLQLIGARLIATGLKPHRVRSIRNLVKDTNKAFDSNLRITVSSC